MPGFHTDVLFIVPVYISSKLLGLQLVTITQNAYNMGERVIDIQTVRIVQRGSLEARWVLGHRDYVKLVRRELARTLLEPDVKIVQRVNTKQEEFVISVQTDDFHLKEQQFSAILVQKAKIRTARLEPLEPLPVFVDHVRLEKRTMWKEPTV